MHFSFVVVDGGKEMLAIETDADTVVSGTLQTVRQGERPRCRSWRQVRTNRPLPAAVA